VAFIKLLTIYQIYLNSLPPSFSLIPPISGIVSTVLIYTHVHTVFAPYSPSYTLSPHPPPFYQYQPPTHRTCSALLFSKFVKEKNDTFVCLRQLYREFPFDIL
jgi:hypothetical protein